MILKKKDVQRNASPTKLYFDLQIGPESASFLENCKFIALIKSCYHMSFLLGQNDNFNN